MKYTIIFTLIALLLIGGGIALLQQKKLFEPAPAGVTGVEVRESTTTVATSNGKTPVVSVNDPLRKQADAILVRPVPAAETMPAAVRADLVKQISDAKGSLHVNYDNLQDWIALGLARKAFEDYAGAADAWEFAGLIRPKNSLSFQNLGFLYGSYLKDYPRAEKNYLQAITNAPAEVATYSNLADLYWYSMPEKQAAIPDLLREGISRAASADGKIALFARLASYYEDAKDVARAIAAIDEALAIAPGQPQLTAERARLEGKL